MRKDGTVVQTPAPDGWQLGGPVDWVGTIHPDGSAVFLGGDPAHHLSMDPDAWARAACQIAGRNLSREEWRRYFADEPYRRTCPRFPAAAEGANGRRE